MKTEDQVCSLEISKRIKELGVPQKSLLYWKTHTGNLFILTCCDIGFTISEENNEKYSAFTVAEGAEALPYRLNVDTKNLQYLVIRRCRLSWLIKYWDYEHDPFIGFENNTLANALGKMLIYLLEKKLIKPTEGE